MPNGSSLEKAAEYYIVTRNMVSSGILAHRRTIVVLNNKKLGSSYELIPDRQKHEKKQILMVKQGQCLLSVFRVGSVNAHHGLLIKLFSWKT